MYIDIWKILEKGPFTYYVMTFFLVSSKSEMSSNQWRENFKEEFLHLKMDKGLKTFLSSLVQQIWPFTETKNAKAKIVDFVTQNISQKLAYDLSSLDTGELILERLKSILMEEVDKIFDINEVLEIKPMNVKYFVQIREDHLENQFKTKVTLETNEDDEYCEDDSRISHAQVTPKKIQNLIQNLSPHKLPTISNSVKIERNFNEECKLIVFPIENFAEQMIISKEKKKKIYFANKTRKIRRTYQVIKNSISARQT